jgi:hypothetical protein
MMVTFASATDSPPFDEFITVTKSNNALGESSMCTRDPLHEQRSDSNSSAFSGADCNDWRTNPEKTVTLIKTGAEETDRIEPFEMREDELEKDEIERERAD